MWIVVESNKADKQLRRCSRQILKQYETWKKTVELSGPSALRAISGYKDHALKGQWAGSRSSYLNIQWRVIYVVEENLVQVKVLEVNPHDYRKKS